jgi:hypothetical protein
MELPLALRRDLRISTQAVEPYVTASLANTS